jgi:hypothetical protein
LKSENASFFKSSSPVLNSLSCSFNKFGLDSEKILVLKLLRESLFVYVYI